MDMLNHDTPAWYVIHTKPKHEERASANLRAWGLDVFAPKLRRRLASRQRGETVVVEPLFPRYIFARFPLALVCKVGLTRGVHEVVSFGNGPASVEPEVMRVLQERGDEQGVATEACPRLERGDRVRVEAGPLRCLEGVFEGEALPAERVRILLTAISFHARVELPRECVSRLAQAPAVAGA